MLGTTSFPFQQPRISLGIVVAVPYTATNQNHTLRIYLVGETRRPTDPVRGGANRATRRTSPGLHRGTVQPRTAAAPIQPGDAQTIPMAVNLDQIRFDVPGAYSFVIEIDDTEVERLIFRVTLPVGLALAAS